jgi:hypothetical protein
MTELLHKIAQITAQGISAIRDLEEIDKVLSLPKQLVKDTTDMIASTTIQTIAATIITNPPDEDCGDPDCPVHGHKTHISAN